MYLRELIDELKTHDPKKECRPGFHHPHSYRGCYGDLAFAPCAVATVGDMLQAAEQALGDTFQGYKGGDFTMGECTDCWLAHYGRTGETIGPLLLWFMLGGEGDPPID